MIEEAQSCTALQDRGVGRLAAGVTVKGVVYCRTKQLCEQLATALGCHAYHAGVASRTEILQEWRQAGGLIVCTSALGVGVDIPGVQFTLHVEQPWSMVDFVQESGRAREGGKAVILVVQQRQRQQQQQQQQRSFSPSQSRVEEEEEEEIKEDSKAMEAFIQAPGCRRVAMSSYMDGLQVNCSELAEMIAPTAVVACNYCDSQASVTLAMPGLCRPGELQQEHQGLLSSGQIAWQEDSRLHAIQERVLCRKLTELTQDVCAYCWGILYEVFDGVRDSERNREEEKAEHSIWECPRLGRVGGAGSVDGAGSVGGIEQIDSVRKWVRYKKEIQVC